MGEDALGRGLVHDPPIMVLFLQNAGFHPQVLQGLFVANLRRRAQALDGVRSVLDALHSDRLQSGELVEYIKELPDAKVPLHFRLSNELNIAEDELLQPAPKILTVGAHTLVREYLLLDHLALLSLPRCRGIRLNRILLDHKGLLKGTHVFKIHNNFIKLKFGQFARFQNYGL